ncbi:MAG: formylglycine-generating enzyme family protein [Deltaproteobacteria bacterium]|nr:formylglycine-generating enzyme family protein [Deltaproteobacteria bacterium]
MSIRLLICLVGVTLLVGCHAPELPETPSFSGDDARGSAAIEWVRIKGGTFIMGCIEGDADCEKSTRPRHLVQLATFELMKTEVTVAAYRACVEAGACSEPKHDSPGCVWDKSGHEMHPINCVSRAQALRFAAFAGGRLPTEAEWEYAARSGGKAQHYPWGNQPPTCLHAVFNDRSHAVHCRRGRTQPVGSRSLGNSVQGVSDLAGNVSEMVADCYQENYRDAHADGSATSPRHRGSGCCYFLWAQVPCKDEDKEPQCDQIVFRGGDWLNNDALALRSTHRDHGSLEQLSISMGFRLARSVVSKPDHLDSEVGEKAGAKAAHDRLSATRIELIGPPRGAQADVRCGETFRAKLEFGAPGEPASLVVPSGDCHIEVSQPMFEPRAVDVTIATGGFERLYLPLRPKVLADAPRPKLEWVRIPAGHRVASFELTRTEITVEQYRACVRAHVCTARKLSLSYLLEPWEHLQNNFVEIRNWYVFKLVSCLDSKMVKFKDSCDEI